MPSIQILPDNLANLIAAGEVVERPASVVKELVENALDAGARRVEVRLEEGGKRLIQVVDDGCGLSAEDLVLAVQRFATSKVRAAEDLASICTLGFRGEALPSIGSVARLEMLSRPAAEAEGHALRVEAGEIVALETVGCAPGTTVTVSELFYHTPARRKFLATAPTERGHAADWVLRLALAHPDRSFRLLHHGTPLLATRGGGDPREVIAAGLGSDVAREMLPVDLDLGGVRLRGFTSTPRLLRANRSYQYFFVNHRYVRSRSLNAALSSAYGMLLPAGRQPVCVLYLELDPQEVDPNVHPTKIEVRFKRPGEVHSLTQQAIAEALAEAGYRSLDQPRYPRPVPPAGGGADLLPAGRVELPGPERRAAVQRLRVNPFSEEVDERDAGLAVHDTPQAGAQLASRTEATPSLPTDHDQLALVGTLWDCYLVVAGPGELLLVDQHRAAERVLFEQLGQRREQAAMQLLALPQTLELTGAEHAALAQGRELLEELGYLLEDFGGSSFLVRGVPAQGAYRDPASVLRALAADLAESGLPTPAEQRREALRASVACHAAIKAGQRLSPPEAQDLLSALLASPTPAVCPHGDPIIVTFARGQVDRRFQR